MEKTLKQIASYVKGELLGDGEIKIGGLAGIEEAKPGELSFLANPKYKRFLEKTKASAVIVGEDIKKSKVSVIRCKNPRFAFCKVTQLFSPDKRTYPEKVEGTAVLGKGVKIGKGVYLGHFVVVEDKVKLEDRVVIMAGSFIGRNSVIKENSIIYPNVTVREEVTIGRNVIVHCGTVIGADGFGYAFDSGTYHKIPQVGKVQIGDFVEIGANVCIDRATLGKTKIGRGTKIDNLVQIGHNVEIGENTVIVSQVGISGSTKIGNNVMIAGQVGLVGHIRIGDRVMVGAKSGISKDIPSDTVVFGYPAREIKKAKKIEACISNLPQWVKRINQLEKRIEKIEGKK
ncbi:MAG: hypothetical protein AMJ90_07490 [candidate division Zixibacteria bacterium SM23_73_2]|nr:MAG: hypothetical protein AMJ90_07490 [candidate division Zixibacteria bacterium SM23_73_2]